MSCLAPQFKWPPSTRAAAFREPGGSFRPGRVHCAVSPAAAVEAERVELSAAGSRRLGYGGALGPPPSSNTTLPENLELGAIAGMFCLRGGSSIVLLGLRDPNETQPNPHILLLITFNDPNEGFGEAILNMEAVVAAAAAEAVALARAAAEVAGEVARMVQTDHRPDFATRDTEDNFLAREILRTEVGSDARHVGVGFLEDTGFSSIVSDESEVGDDEQCIRGVAVKSARQSDRRARRVRATMKAVKSFSARKPIAASSRKKRLKGCRNPLGCLYKMTGRRLLTAKQEVEFSEGIQDLLKLEAIQKELAHYNGGEPFFSQWAAAAGTDENTLRKRLNYGIYCKNTMVRSNVRLVISIAREFEGPGMEFSDLIQEGMQGLVRGAEKFDASKGFRFSTYSHWWIKQAIRKSVLEQTQIIRLPAHMADASSRVKECRRRLHRELKRLPTNEEIASDTGMPIRRVEAAMSLPKYRVSLTGKVGCTDVTYQEITPDTSAETAEEMLHRWFMKKDVDRALDSLSPRERQVIRYRFGMDDGRLRTLHDIGQLMGVSRERIRQIELGAFRKLRSKKMVESLQHYLEPVESW